MIWLVGIVLFFCGCHGIESLGKHDKVSENEKGMSCGEKTCSQDQTCAQLVYDRSGITIKQQITCTSEITCSMSDLICGQVTTSMKSNNIEISNCKYICGPVYPEKKIVNRCDGEICGSLMDGCMRMTVTYGKQVFSRKSCTLRAMCETQKQRVCEAASTANCEVDCNVNFDGEKRPDSLKSDNRRPMAITGYAASFVNEIEHKEAEDKDNGNNEVKNAIKGMKCGDETCMEDQICAQIIYKQHGAVIKQDGTCTSPMICGMSDLICGRLTDTMKKNKQEISDCQVKCGPVTPPKENKCTGQTCQSMMDSCMRITFKLSNQVNSKSMCTLKSMCEIQKNTICPRKWNVGPDRQRPECKVECGINFDDDIGITGYNMLKTYADSEIANWMNEINLESRPTATSSASNAGLIVAVAACSFIVAFGIIAAIVLVRRRRLRQTPGVDDYGAIACSRDEGASLLAGAGEMSDVDDKVSVSYMVKR